MTLIEVMVACLILVGGMAGVVTIVSGANRAADLSYARVSANHLAREVLEDARAVDYDDLNPTDVAAALQALPGLSGSGSPWTVTRRQQTYTISVSTCTFDDPRDGIANGTSVPAPTNACPAATAESGAPTESNPDDFRRVEATITWTLRNKTDSITLTDSIVNPSGGLGPRIKTITQPSAQITSGTSVSIPVTTTPNAASLHWIVDTTSTDDDATGGPSSWTISWPIGTAGASGSVLDGTYTVNAQPFDTRGVPGDTRPAVVQINRSLPFAPTGLAGGRNTAFGPTVVDLEWNGNLEKDIIGYRVYRGTTLVCGTAATPLNALSCSDSNAPGSGTLQYTVVAVDRTDIANTASAMREGAASATLSVGAASTALAKPTGLAVTVVGNLAHLAWTAPATGTVAFYRIYRDGKALGDRIARTATNATYFDDASWDGNSHRWYVTAVNAGYNESDSSDRADL